MTVAKRSSGNKPGTLNVILLQFSSSNLRVAPSLFPSLTGKVCNLSIFTGTTRGTVRFGFHG